MPINDLYCVSIHKKGLQQKYPNISDLTNFHAREQTRTSEVWFHSQT